MTSQVSLNKLMKIDMKHRKWMLILSIAVQMICGPVFFLLSISNTLISNGYHYAKETGRDVVYLFNDISQSISGSFGFMATIVVIIGALIVSVAGFRHLYSKKMMDMYGSIPVTRTRQFLSIYLNGLLIWAIPFLASTALSTAICCFALSGSEFVIPILSSIAHRALVCTVSFLAVYHLCLLCTVMSGHPFVAIATSIVLGVDAIVLYELIYTLEDSYLKCFLQPIISEQMIGWLSPFATGFMITMPSVTESPVIYAVFICGTVLLIVLNFFLSLMLYKGRKSELAEGGMSNKIFMTFFKITNTVLLGLLGYNFMSFFLGTNIPAWCFFGLALFSVAGYGVINIILNRSGRAFFKEKQYLFISLGIVVFITSALSFDLFKIDSYVPSKNNIKEASIYFPDYCDQSMNYDFQDNEIISLYGMSEKQRMDKYVVTDQELIYNLLSTGAENTKNNSIYRNDGPLGFLFFENYEDEYTDYETYASVFVSVTLKSGITYTKRYRLSNKDSDIILSIIQDEKYQEAFYPLSMGNFPYPDEIHIWNYNGEISNEYYITNSDEIKEFMGAYSKDFKNNIEQLPEMNYYSDASIEAVYYVDEYDTNDNAFTNRYYIYLDIPNFYEQTYDIIDTLPISSSNNEFFYSE